MTCAYAKCESFRSIVFRFLPFCRIDQMCSEQLESIAKRKEKLKFDGHAMFIDNEQLHIQSVCVLAV